MARSITSHSRRGHPSRWRTTALHTAQQTPMVVIHVPAHHALVNTLAYTYAHTLCWSYPALPNPSLHLRCRATNTVAAMLTCRPGVGCCATCPGIAPTAGSPPSIRLPCMQPWGPASDPSPRLSTQTSTPVDRAPPTSALLVHAFDSEGDSLTLPDTSRRDRPSSPIAPSSGVAPAVMFTAACSGGSVAGLYPPPKMVCSSFCQFLVRYLRSLVRQLAGPVQEPRKGLASHFNSYYYYYYYCHRGSVYGRVR
jgi:hypothetical protein